MLIWSDSLTFQNWINKSFTVLAGIVNILFVPQQRGKWPRILQLYDTLSLNRINDWAFEPYLLWRAPLEGRWATEIHRRLLILLKNIFSLAQRTFSSCGGSITWWHKLCVCLCGWIFQVFMYIKTIRKAYTCFITSILYYHTIYSALNLPKPCIFCGGKRDGGMERETWREGGKERETKTDRYRERHTDTQRMHTRIQFLLAFYGWLKGKKRKSLCWGSALK